MAEVLGPDERREIDRIRRALSLGEGPELHLIVGDTRRVVDAALAEVLPGVEPPHETVAPEEAPKAFAVRWTKWLEAAVREGGTRPVVLDAWDVDPEHVEHWGWIFARLNERRNEIMRELGRPLLLLVSPDNERLLARMAPDLWSIRRVGMRLHDRAKVAASRHVRRTREAAKASSMRPPMATEIENQRARVAHANTVANRPTQAIEATRMAQLLLESGPRHRAEALTFAEDAVAGYAALVQDDPTQAQGLAHALRIHAEIAARMGRRPTARADLERAIGILEGLKSGRTQEHEHELAEIQELLGDLKIAQGLDEEASRLYDRAAAIRARRPAHEEPSSSRSPTLPPRVFISYSHDSNEHADRVLELASHLRGEGINVRLDQYVDTPPEGWPAWVERQVSEADFVLFVCTSTYRRRFEHEVGSEEGPGMRWEGILAKALLYKAGGRSDHMIPVLLEGGEPTDIPLPLRAFTHYRLPSNYESLYRRLTGHFETPSPLLGPIRYVYRALRPPSPSGRDSRAETNDVGHVIASPSPSPAIILLLHTRGADPDRRLAIHRAHRFIADALLRASERDRYILRSSDATTSAEVTRVIDEIQPTIVHFAGHEPSDATLLGAPHKPPLLVVLGTASSRGLAEVAAHEVAHALGFERIDDGIAQHFCATFYERLASQEGFDVPRAFTLARLACLSEGYDDAENARLFEYPGHEVTGG